MLKNMKAENVFLLQKYHRYIVCGMMYFTLLQLRLQL